MSYQIEDSILTQEALYAEVRSVLNSYFQNVYETDSYFNFRCNRCGDSQSNPKEKHGYIMKKESGWYYYCHKGGCGGMNLKHWLKTYFPSNYESYRGSTFKPYTTSTAPTTSNIQTVKPQVDPYKEKAIISSFKPILDYPEIVKQCTDRMIPYETYSKWFYCDTGVFKKRMIIPFYNHKNKIYYYQGRATEDWIKPKYKSREGDHNNIYGYYLVDREKEVIVLEGPIDSCFVENSIAVTGLKVNDEKLNVFGKKYFLVDNDDAGREVGMKLLKNGEYVFLWKKFLKDFDCGDGEVKDVNDFVLKNKNGIKFLTFSMLSNYFSNRIFDSLWLK